MPHRYPSTPPLRRGVHPAWSLCCRALAGLVVASTLLPATATAQTGAQGAVQAPAGAPQALSNAEFWDFFVTKSEAGGSFVSENFVSNEMTFQHVIPTLQRTLTPGGVYLGVGPEQNYTYIANLKPRMAVIFDIRRQNAMHHLMYKALFELSPTRAEFVARLFSRPSLALLGADVSAQALFDSAEVAEPSDSVYDANRAAIKALLTEQRGFALSDDDLATIAYLYRVFYEAGPEINYGYRPGAPMSLRASYPTFGMLQAATNIDGAPMAFLATEENYRVVRDMHLQNLIIPVVGNFAGPSAIRAVGDYLRERHLTVTAFYLSNVEQYLFRRRQDPGLFYGNVASLPIDTTSTLIRSVPPGPQYGGPNVVFSTSGSSRMIGPSGIASISIIDSGGVRVLRVDRDSAGTRLVQVYQDSAGQMVPRRVDSTSAPVLVHPDTTRVVGRQDSLVVSPDRVIVQRDSLPIANRRLPGRVAPPRMIMGGLLTSGLVGIRETLDAFFAGQLSTYTDAIRMTRTTGWK